ncbi:MULTISPECIES: MarR family winged helix-turn-helix transcriptional regulator [Gammaproteobacteria]|uniref:MarR family transcriptional regulator n=1 Tax=Xanthomonas boreopolis TaxID=86183 RepID=A0A919KKA3_9XANT|nr:MarR family transcriptional regulator [Pseudomonas sp. Hp2]GHH59315.1 MarR family transcriptional regulator [[Pseudomonas] boreopolis]
MDTLPPLTQLSSGLLLASRQWQRLVDAALEPFGISGACTAPLLLIGRSGGGIRQVALAQKLGMEGPSLVRLLDRLGEQGLVRRECDAHDRRANQLWLTEAGQALVGQLEARLVELRRDVLGTLSPAEVEAVLKLWRLIGDASEKHD